MKKEKKVRFFKKKKLGLVSGDWVMVLFAFSFLLCVGILLFLGGMGWRWWPLFWVYSFHKQKGFKI